MDSMNSLIMFSLLISNSNLTATSVFASIYVAATRDSSIPSENFTNFSRLRCAMDATRELACPIRELVLMMMIVFSGADIVVRKIERKLKDNKRDAVFGKIN